MLHKLIMNQGQSQETAFCDITHLLEMFSDVIMPEGITNLMIWYGKEDFSFCGITAKSTLSGKAWDKDCLWKISWLKNENGDFVPSQKSLEVFDAEMIPSNLCDMINVLIKQDQMKKNNIKKTTFQKPSQKLSAAKKVATSKKAKKIVVPIKKMEEEAQDDNDSIKLD